MKIKNLEDKIIKWVTLKKISIITTGLFLLSMIPNWYLAFFARPSGDDYNYSASARQVWQQTKSLIEVLKISLATTKDACQNWNGDWFSVYLFTLMPEVFVDRSFWIVPVFWSAAVIVSTYLFLDEILHHYLKIERYGVLLMTSLVLLMCYQWIPSSAIGLYWYVGVIHYMMPHVLALLVITFLLKYLRKKQWRYLIAAIPMMIGIGGSSYYSFFLVLFSFLLLCVCFRKDFRRTLFFLLPLGAGGIALYFHITAPGNAARVGEAMEFTFSKGIMTVIMSLVQGFTRIGEYFQEKTLLFVLLFLLTCFLWEYLLRTDCRYHFPFPLLWVFYMYGVYASMFAPEVYAETDISGGPPTMEYITFILVTFFSILYVEGWMITRGREKGWLKEGKQNQLLIRAIVIAMFAAALFRSGLKQTLFFESVEYIVSGQARDYKEQMEYQLFILLDESQKIAYLQPTNPEQGPLMHMPVIEDPNAFTNKSVARFYGKELVVTVEE